METCLDDTISMTYLAAVLLFPRCRFASGVGTGMGSGSSKRR